MQSTVGKPSAWPVPPLIQASGGVHLAAAGLAVALPEMAGWALGGVVLNHLALTAAGLWPRSDWLGPNHRRLPDEAARRGQVAITIDDGPDPDVTPRVLDLLDEHALVASFFCIAERAKAQPVLVREIVARGHAVENHSAVHRHNFSLLGLRGFEREIGSAQAVLADLTGRVPTCFRAPAGLRNPFLDPVLHRLGLHLVSWTRRGFDTRERDPQRVLARLSRDLAAGDILLMHDGHAARTSQGRAVLLDVLPGLAQRLTRSKLSTITLADVLVPRGSLVA
jgi:peptidoglycan/xylan/chitin deacetylase (PgdA/CDA1 family)